MKSKSYQSLLWSSFLKIQGILIGILGLVVALLAWFFLPSTTIPLACALPLLIIAIVVIATFAEASSVSFTNSKKYLPKVVKATNPPSGFEALGLCLLEPSELFSYDMAVSFYFIEDKFERLLGVGYVINIQNDGYIQVILKTSVVGSEDIVERLFRNEKNALEMTRIKPNVPRIMLQTER